VGLPVLVNESIQWLSYLSLVEHQGVFISNLLQYLMSLNPNSRRLKGGDCMNADDRSGDHSCSPLMQITDSYQPSIMQFLVSGGRAG
jgi:hypothetical protein